MRKLGAVGQVHWFNVDRERLVFEYTIMRRSFPAFKLLKFGDHLAWDGEIHDIPPGIDAMPLRVRLTYPSAYPIAPPQILPLEPELPVEHWGHTWHRWPSGRICIVEPKYWEPSYTAADALTKAGDWYFNYLAKLHGLADEMPDQGRAHINEYGGST